MIYLVYYSSAAYLMDDAALLNILQVSRRNNARDGVTGLLLYRAGTFLQVLEGEEGAVDSAYERIRQDHRHRGIIDVLRRPAPQRLFPDWSMGFTNIDQVEPSRLEGYSDLLLQPRSVMEMRGQEHLVHRLLLNFRDSMQ